MEQLKNFIQNFPLKSSENSLKLNSTDSEFLQSLLTRPSLSSSRRKEKNRKKKINLITNFYFY